MTPFSRWATNQNASRELNEWSSKRHAMERCLAPWRHQCMGSWTLHRVLHWARLYSHQHRVSLPLPRAWSSDLRPLQTYVSMRWWSSSLFSREELLLQMRLYRSSFTPMVLSEKILQIGVPFSLTLSPTPGHATLAKYPTICWMPGTVW